MRQDLDQKSHYLLASVIVLITVIAFFPLVPTASVFSSALTASRIIELGLLVFAGFVVTLAILGRRCPLSFTSHAPFISISFALWALLSTMWSKDLALSFAKSVELILLIYITLALAIYIKDISANSTRAATVVIANGLLGSVVVLLIANFVIWGTPLKFAEMNMWSGRQGRLYFGYAYPLETGELVTSAAIAIFITNIRVPIRSVIVLSLLVLLFLTNARNLILIYPIVIAAVTYQHGSTEVRFIIVIGAVCSFIMLLVLAVSGELTRFIPYDLWTLNSRVPLWAKATEFIVDNPLLGVGYFASRHYLLDMFQFAAHAHNSYVQTMLTTGVVGLSILLIFLGYCTKVAISTNSSLLLGFLVLNALGSIFNPLILRPNPTTFLLMLSLLVVAEQNASIRNRRRCLVRDPVQADHQYS